MELLTVKQLSLPNSPLTVSRLGLGAGGFGTRLDHQRACALLEQFRAAGGNLVDTAHCYAAWLPGGDGASEQALGAALRDLGRADFVVATKGGHPGMAGYPRPERYLDPDTLRRDLDDSLARLGFAPVDLYYLHRDDPRVPVDELLGYLNSELADGRIRALGASNWSLERLQLAREHATAAGLTGFAITQDQWSLATPDWPEGDDPTMRYVTPSAAAWHVAASIPVAAYTSTAGGWFAGREVGVMRSPANVARRDRAVALADELSTTPTQVALAWLLAQPSEVIPLIGTGDPEHLAEAIGAMALELPPERVCWLRDG